TAPACQIELGADTVGAHHQHGRPIIVGEPNPGGEAAEIADHVRVPGGSDTGCDAVDMGLGAVEVDAGVPVVHVRSSFPTRTSTPRSRPVSDSRPTDKRCRTRRLRSRRADPRVTGSPGSRLPGAGGSLRPPSGRRSEWTGQR